MAYRKSSRSSARTSRSRGPARGYARRSGRGGTGVRARSGKVSARRSAPAAQRIRIELIGVPQEALGAARVPNVQGLTQAAKPAMRRKF